MARHSQTQYRYDVFQISHITRVMSVYQFFLSFCMGLSEVHHPNRQSSIRVSIRYYPSRHHFILDRSCKDTGDHQVVNAFLFLCHKEGKLPVVKVLSWLVDRRSKICYVGQARIRFCIARASSPDCQVNVAPKS